MVGKKSNIFTPSRGAFVGLLILLFLSVTWQSFSPKSLRDFKKVDEAGGKIDCDKLMNSVRISFLISAGEYKIGRLTQCREQIESERAKACNDYAKRLKTSYRDKEVWLDARGEELVCNREVVDALGEIEDKYKIIQRESENFLLLEVDNSSIPMKRIDRVTITKLTPFSPVWTINIFALKEQYTLYFTDDKKAKKHYSRIRKMLLSKKGA